MDMSSFSILQLLIFVGICVLLFLQKIAMKNGHFVKVEYSKPKRLFWAVLISSIIACPGIYLGNIYFVLFAVSIGFYLYFFKQWYAHNRE